MNSPKADDRRRRSSGGAADHPAWDERVGTPKDRPATDIVEDAHGQYSASGQSDDPARNASAVRSAGAHGPAQTPGFDDEGANPQPQEQQAGKEPMTRAQASRLNTLCEEAKVETPTRPLSRREASALIDQLEARLTR
ncbi:DUF3072 domain-containing protein [Reyranella sp.]|uniref:DUF3072 domain-containing protein n=1 Tax=Reyranella sp. TaxID=1929291 RepID=UPI003BA86C07